MMIGNRLGHNEALRFAKGEKVIASSFDPIPDAHHFLQNTHGAEVADFLTQRISEE
jgi:hypothetical protein